MLVSSLNFWSFNEAQYKYCYLKMFSVVESKIFNWLSSFIIDWLQIDIVE